MLPMELTTTSLNALHIKYDIVDYANPLSLQTLSNNEPISAKNVVLSLLLNNIQNETIMILFPCANLVNAPALLKLLRGKYRPVELTHIRETVEIPSLVHLPPVTKAFNARLIADASLLHIDPVYFPLGDGQHLVRVSQLELQKLLKNASLDNFTASISQLIKSAAQDIEDGVKSSLGMVRFTPQALRKRIESRHEFPVMSQAAQKILKLQSNPNSDASDLAIVIEESPSLAGQVIKWANSPFYAYPGKIKSIQDAIVKVLGFDLVMNMALGLAIGNKFKIPTDGVIGLNAYWQHSVFTGSLEERLVKAMPVEKRPSLGLTYLTGLLHNFGYLVLGELFLDHFNLENMLINYNPHLTIPEIEHCVLGVGHEQLGAWLMESWHMPSEVIHTTQWHHENTANIKEDQPYVALTNTAITLLKCLGMGGDALTDEVPQENLDLLGLNAKNLFQVSAEFGENVENLQDVSQLIAHG